MRYRLILCLLFLFVVLVAAQSETSTSDGDEEEPTPSATATATADESSSSSAESEEPQTTKESSSKSDSKSSSPTTTRKSATGGSGGSSTAGRGSSSTAPADVLLRVPNLSIGRIELDVDNLQAEINLAAQVAKLVEINAGVQVGIEKVNITIADVSAKLELVIRLGHLVDIVNRTLQSLDLNPLLINLLDTVTDVATNLIGAVDGLLGSVVKGNSRLNFYIDNLGNVVQEVVNEAGDVLSSIVGNYKQNMTYTGQSENVGDGLTQKTYEYSPLGSLVNIIFNGLDQIVSAHVIKSGSGGNNESGADIGGGGGGDDEEDDEEDEDSNDGDDDDSGKKDEEKDKDKDKDDEKSSSTSSDKPKSTSKGDD